MFLLFSSLVREVKYLSVSGESFVAYYAYYIELGWVGTFC